MTDLNLSINPVLLEKLKKLDGYFFEVLQRAEKIARNNGKVELSNDDVKNILAQDVTRYLGSEPIAASQLKDGINNNEKEKVRKLIELAQGLSSQLQLIAGFDQNRRSFQQTPQQQRGPSGSTQENNQAMHPALENFVDVAAASLFDLYEAIDQENKVSDNNNENKNENKLDNALRNAKKFIPAFSQLKPELKPQAPTPKPQPQFIPTMALKPR